MVLGEKQKEKVVGMVSSELLSFARSCNKDSDNPLPLILVGSFLYSDPADISSIFVLWSRAVFPRPLRPCFEETPAPPMIQSYCL